MKKEELYDEAIKKFGAPMQLVVCIEEMAELAKELTKAYRGYRNNAHLAEEIADVEITVEQMKRYFKLEIPVKCQKDKKLLRLEERIKGI